MAGGIAGMAQHVVLLLYPFAALASFAVKKIIPKLRIGRIRLHKWNYYKKSNQKKRKLVSSD